MSAHAGYDVALVHPELIEDPELRAAPPIPRFIECRRGRRLPPDAGGGARVR